MAKGSSFPNRPSFVSYVLLSLPPGNVCLSVCPLYREVSKRKSSRVSQKRTDESFQRCHSFHSPSHYPPPGGGAFLVSMESFPPLSVRVTPGTFPPPKKCSFAPLEHCQRMNSRYSQQLSIVLEVGDIWGISPPPRKRFVASVWCRTTNR